MTTVLEEVEEGHGGEGEAVNEQGFEFALDEVRNYHLQAQFLEFGSFWDLGEGEGRETVDLWTKEVNEQVNNDGSEILDHENCTPVDLRTEIFDGNGASIPKADVDDGGVCVGENDGAIAPLCDA